ncbi:hypothetical protein [Nostoc sp. JL33]|uniref:hypothetical protein n=1 Tax=Nostoc sp. JL33 TaxID=2815396 RepID=UPI0025DAF3FC|nr:hypothetical protein [Nostoc sp. JL33]MBN3869978.1 hypothetical protein [Nostoc sp. JL33]
MQSTLFTELTASEEANLSGGGGNPPGGNPPGGNPPGKKDKDKGGFYSKIGDVTGGTVGDTTISADNIINVGNKTKS